MNGLGGILGVVGIILVAIVAIGLIYSRLYVKAGRTEALVRTGLGGRRVIIDGGALMIPVIHEMMRVNLSTLQLSVERKDEDALITKDRYRVDVQVDFYVAVAENEDSVSAAARTLGDRTFDPSRLRALVEGKLVDALRAIAATMDLSALHEDRSNFVEAVKDAVAQDLERNGLELESVSLTGLDQTPTTNLDPNNVFNAVALAKTAEVVAENEKARAKAQADARVSAAQESSRAEKEEISQRRAVETAELEKSRDIAISTSETQLEARRKDIETTREAELQEVAKNEAIERARVEKERQIEVAEQDKAIIVATKSREESEAKKLADEARAEAAKAEERITTARQTEAAERAKRIAVVKAQESAEVDATRIKLAAEAEKDAAVAIADAAKTRAEGEKIAAEFEAVAITAKAQAEADAKRLIHEADNALQKEVRDHFERMAEIDVAPRVAAEMVKPLQGVGDNMKIVTVNGLTGAGGDGGSAMDPLKSVLSGLAIWPALKRIGGEIGMDMDTAFAGDPAGAVKPPETSIDADADRDDGRGLRKAAE